jgi:glycosyltransferase involved in cell wall biosynthesis
LQRDVLVLVPAFNEEGNVAGVVHDVHTCLPDADVLVIDDGSATTPAGRPSPRAPASCACR